MISLKYGARLKTVATNEAGYPELFTEKSLNLLNLQHLVYVHDSLGTELLYLNGEKIGDGFRPSNFENWPDTYYLRFGNESDRNLPYSGLYYTVAIYSKALSQNEINKNYTVGPTDNVQAEGIDYTINICPNPTTDKTMIEVTPTTSSLLAPYTVMKISNMYGKIISEESIFNPNDEFTKTIDLKSFPKGLYFIQIISGDKFTSSKLILQ
jgi:hypothetical protein